MSNGPLLRKATKRSDSRRDILSGGPEMKFVNSSRDCVPRARRGTQVQRRRHEVPLSLLHRSPMGFARAQPIPPVKSTAAETVDRQN
jgi:hypothetical protein